MKDFKPGMKVIYTPWLGCDERAKEKGVVTSIGKYWIFVDYTGKGIGVATDPLDLEVLHED